MKKELKGSSDSKLQKLVNFVFSLPHTLYYFRKLESKMKQLPKLEEQLKKLEIQATDKVEDVLVTINLNDSIEITGSVP